MRACSVGVCGGVDVWVCEILILDLCALGGVRMKSNLDMFALCDKYR